MKKELVIELFSALLILLWVYTGVSKYIDFGRFKYVLAESPLIKDYSLQLAYIIPGLELLIALFLLIPKTRIIGFVTSFCLLLLFTIYLIYMVGFTKNLPCQCGGVIAKMTWTQHIFFNLVMALIALWAIWLRNHDFQKLFRRNTPSLT